jgi:hypothetical protein
MCMPQPCHVNLPHPEHLHLKHLRTREARAYSSAKTHTHRNSASQHRAQRFREAWCGATRRRTGRVRACSARGCATLPCFAQLSSPPAAPLSHFSRTSLARLSHGCRHTMGSASRLYDDARKQSGNGFDDERTHSSGSSAPGSTRTG